MEENITKLANELFVVRMKSYWSHIEQRHQTDVQFLTPLSNKSWDNRPSKDLITKWYKECFDIASEVLAE